jgi:peroxiredoxin
MTNKDTTIAEQAAVVRRESPKRRSAELNAVFDAELAETVADGVPAGVAEPGTPMPDGDLLDVHGSPTTLTAARDGRVAVVVFYRGAWCPYCNLTLRTYQNSLVDKLNARGVALVAVSPQKPDLSLSLAEKHALTYTVLSDPGNQIAKALGIVYTQAEYAREGYAELGVDLADIHADGTYELPLATTVLVGEDGMIRWIDVHPDYTTRSEVAEILAAVDALQ